MKIFAIKNYYSYAAHYLKVSKDYDSYVCQDGKIQKLKNIRWQKKLRERYEEKERFISFIDCSEYSGRYGLVLKRTI